jgi:hypothetical protein
MRDHERMLQTELAHLRNPLIATPPGEAGPDPQAVITMVTAISERYPELKANSSILNLQQNLIDTEQRIALARGYFNEIASFYDARLLTIPDRFLAALGAKKSKAPMTADNFERASVEVKFAN